MTKKKDKVTPAGPVELSDTDLEKASGGYYDGAGNHLMDSAAKTPATKSLKTDGDILPRG